MIKLKMTDYSDLDDEQIRTQWYRLSSMSSCADDARARIDMVQNGMSEAVKQPAYDDRSDSIADELREIKEALNRIQALLERDMRTIEDRRGGKPDS